MLGNHDLLTVAAAAAERAAAFIRSTSPPSRPAGWARKGLNDFVTEVDREAERMITTYIHERCPASTVLGEELSPETETEELVWVVDPLDGTTNFLHGYPAYAVSVAAVRRGVPQAGVVVDVCHETTYTAVAGQGAWRDTAPLRVSSVHEPSDALLGTGFPFKVPDLLPSYLRQFERLLRETTGVRRAGAAALDLVDVACGRFDGFWELHLAPWDVAAGTLLVREAGGVVTDADGSPDVIKHGPIVAGNPSIHRWLLGRLAD